MEMKKPYAFMISTAVAAVIGSSVFGQEEEPTPVWCDDRGCVPEDIPVVHDPVYPDPEYPFPNPNGMDISYKALPYASPAKWAVIGAGQ